MTARSFLKAVTPAALRPNAFAERYLRRLYRDLRIQTGPFEGMQFTSEQWDPDYSLPLAKLLGTYEMELHPLIERLVHVPFDRIVDIGAADGYYAIGFARRCPSARIIAYEELSAGRDVVRRLAIANDVADRVDVRGRCERPELNAALQGGARPMVMMDVEGHERVLLDPCEVPELAHARILFEAHDCYVPGVGREICQRFEASHTIEAIASRSRRLDDARAVDRWLKLYSKYNVTGWMGERLHPVTWFYLEPRV